jgi:hypothetical protein
MSSTDLNGGIKRFERPQRGFLRIIVNPSLAPSKPLQLLPRPYRYQIWRLIFPIISKLAEMIPAHVAAARSIKSAVAQCRLRRPAPTPAANCQDSK